MFAAVDRPVPCLSCGMRIPTRTCYTAFVLALLQAQGVTGQSPTGIVSGTVKLGVPSLFNVTSTGVGGVSSRVIDGDRLRRFD